MGDISITTWHGICSVVTDTNALRGTTMRPEERWLGITRDSLRTFRQSEEKRCITLLSGWSCYWQPSTNCYCCQIKPATSRVLSMFCLPTDTLIESKREKV